MSSLSAVMLGVSTEHLVVMLRMVGISARGLESVREKEVTGSMLLEFCEEDIKDVFVEFKDRFLIRKVLRGDSPLGGPQAAYAGQWSSYAASNLHMEPMDVAQSAAALMKNDVLDRKKLVNPFAESMAAALLLSPFNQGKSTGDSSSNHRLVSNQNRLLNENESSSHHKSTEKTENRTNERGRTEASSSHADSDDKQKASSSVEENLSFIKKEVEDTPPEHAFPIQSFESELGYSLESLQEQACHFSASEILSKKSQRSQPNRGQRFGSILLREAAAYAGLWNNPPLMKHITLEQRSRYISFAVNIAPQLESQKPLLWQRLSEIMQNRRKYLLDKKIGKRGQRSRSGAKKDKEPEDSSTNNWVFQSGDSKSTFEVIDFVEVKNQDSEFSSSATTNTSSHGDDSASQDEPSTVLDFSTCGDSAS